MLQKQGYGNEILFQEHSITDAGRKVHHLYTSNHIDERAETKENRLVCAYAFAASEENASCDPICGLVQIPRFWA